MSGKVVDGFSIRVLSVFKVFQVGWVVGYEDVACDADAIDAFGCGVDQQRLANSRYRAFSRGGCDGELYQNGK